MPKSIRQKKNKKNKKKKVRGVNMQRSGRAKRVRVNAILRDTRAATSGAITSTNSSVGFRVASGNRFDAMGPAPRHEGVRSPGNRFSFDVGSLTAIRSASQAGTMFLWTDNSTEVYAVWGNPLTYVDSYQGETDNVLPNATDNFRSLWGASTISKQISLYTRYAIRRLEVSYVPSSGIGEVGGAVIAVRNDLDTGTLTFSDLKNTAGCHEFPLNRPMTYRAVWDASLAKPASKLCYIDPTSVTDKNLFSDFAIFAATDDVQSTATKKIGTWRFRGIIDVYNLQGAIAPSEYGIMLPQWPDGSPLTNEQKSFVDRVNRGEARRPITKAKAMPLPNPVWRLVAPAQVCSMSTSSVSVAVAPAAVTPPASLPCGPLRAQIPDAKEAKEVKEPSRPGNGSCQAEAWQLVRKSTPGSS